MSTVYDDYFDEWMRILEAYVSSAGHACVPRMYVLDGYRLGQWVCRQRRHHADGALDPGRAERLGRLPGWTWSPRTDRWGTAFGMLEQYVRQHGSAAVPRTTTVDGFKLGTWVATQRRLHIEDRLSGDREARLEAQPGWTWGPHDTSWENGYRMLQTYVKRHRDSCVPSSCEIDGFRLGGWVSAQRIRHSNHLLRADRAERLEALPGWTWLRPR